MTIEQVVFILVSVVTLGASIVVVTSRNLFRAALALMLSFLGVAGFYLMLDAGFLAAAQLLVYIGAISILIIFSIMLTRRLMQTTEHPYNSQLGMGIGASVLTFAIFAYVIVRYWPGLPDPDVPLATRPVVAESVIRDSVAAMGRAFVGADAYVIPFELASVLLLAAMVGAILIAWPSSEEPS